MNAAADKIQMLNASLRCFAFGLLALLPIFGFPFAIAALVVSAKVRRGQRRFWNAGRSYWVAGVLCASMGFIFWSFISLLVVWNIINAPQS